MSTIAQSDRAFVPTRDDGYTPRIGGHGSLTASTFQNVTNYSDIVAIGTVTDKSSGLVPCCESMAARAAVHFPDAPGPSRMVETITLNVQTAYKGSPPSALTIKTEKPGGTVGRSGDEKLALLDFEVGQQYVLFLVERAGHYEIQGSVKGMWFVDGIEAVQVGTGERYTPAELQEKVESYR